jgi:hypothetical protein
VTNLFPYFGSTEARRHCAWHIITLNKSIAEEWHDIFYKQ